MKMTRDNVLAIIPARGGSKGIPHKNIRLLNGKPLIAYSIEAALKASNITRTIVSTDDRNIADAALEHGAQVPFLRPPHLSGDRAQIQDAINYTLDKLRRDEGYAPEFIAVLYPTSPFRTPSLIEHLVDIGLTQRCRVITVRKIVQDDLNLFVRNDQGRLKPLRENNPVYPEEKRTFYRSYGVFNSVMPNTTTHPYLHVLDNDFSFLDIDTEADLDLAERVIRNQLFDFNA